MWRSWGSLGFCGLFSGYRLPRTFIQGEWRFFALLYLQLGYVKGSYRINGMYKINGNAFYFNRTIIKNHFSLGPGLPGMCSKVTVSLYCIRGLYRWMDGWMGIGRAWITWQSLNAQHWTRFLNTVKLGRGAGKQGNILSRGIKFLSMPVDGWRDGRL